MDEDSKLHKFLTPLNIHLVNLRNLWALVAGYSKV